MKILILSLLIASPVGMANEKSVEEKLIDDVFGGKSSGTYEKAKPSRERVAGLQHRATKALGVAETLQAAGEELTWEKLVPKRDRDRLNLLVPDDQYERRVRATIQAGVEASDSHVLRGYASGAGVSASFADRFDELERAKLEARKLQELFWRTMDAGQKQRLRAMGFSSGRGAMRMASYEPITLEMMDKIISEHEIRSSSHGLALERIRNKYVKIPDGKVIEARIASEDLRAVRGEVDKTLRNLGQAFLPVQPVIEGRIDEEPMFRRISKAKKVVKSTADFATNLSLVAGQKTDQLGELAGRAAVRRGLIGNIGDRLAKALGRDKDFPQKQRIAVSNVIKKKVLGALVGVGTVGAVIEWGVRGNTARQNARIPRIGDAQVGGK